MPEDFLRLSAADRKDALGVAARSSGRPAHILEKDAMVVWALDAVTSSAFGGDIVFKGGTSLSKVHGAIRRFSEDIDLTYDVRKFAGDLVDAEGRPAARSKSQMRRWSDEIKARLESWAKDEALPRLIGKAAEAGLRATIEAIQEKIVISYQPIFVGTGYLPPRIVLEFGARSTGEPNDLRKIACDAAPYLPSVRFPIAMSRVMKIERTFWEKATAVHVYCLQQRLRQQRFSRHWSDLANLAEAGHAAAALSDRAIADAVGQDKSLLYPEKDVAGAVIDYPAAVSGELSLVPEGAAKDALGADYEKMIEDGYFPERPATFEAVIARCAEIEEQANAAGAKPNLRGSEL